MFILKSKPILITICIIIAAGLLIFPILRPPRAIFNLAPTPTIDPYNFQKDQSMTASPTLAPRPSLTPSLTPTPNPNFHPLTFPLPLPDQKQLEEARQCDIEKLITARYPESTTTSNLNAAYSPTTACDWAVLAAAYAARAETDETALSEGQPTWVKAVSQNTAYALSDQLFFGYASAPAGVTAPDLTSQSLTEIKIRYQWSGYGDSVQYEISMTKADAQPEISGTVNGLPYSGTTTIESESLQNLGKSLMGLIPVAKTSSMIACYDNYPDWNVTLTYLNGQKVELKNYGSNIYYFGGPWWVSIDNQQYIQTSTTSLRALAQIVSRLNLPVGEPAGMACHPLEDTLLNILY